MGQIVEPLDADDLADVAAKREWVLGHYEPHARAGYDTVRGKLALIDAILTNGWVNADETLKLQCLGIAFGDALSQHLGLSWVAVEDEYGRDPALRIDGTSVLTFPMTSISKRVERGESVDVFDLFNSACDALQEAADDCD
jgi:hypothetical protein